MTTFVGKGQDIARAIDNALLFCDPKAEHLPGIVHVGLTHVGVTFSACDDYATGTDRVGDHGLFGYEEFQITEENAETLVKAARSARTKSVTLALYGTPASGPGPVTGQELSLILGEDVTTVEVTEPSPAWNDVLPLMVASAVTEVLPHTVAFNAARFAKFGRVKGAKDAPMDIRFYPAQGAPIALVKVGPTFRGELVGVRRDEALKHMGPEGPDCFW